MDMLVLNACSESFKGHCSSKILIEHCSRLFLLLYSLGHRGTEEARGHRVGQEIDWAATKLGQIASIASSSER
jgi:hypothetical protein